MTQRRCFVWMRISAWLAWLTLMGTLLQLIVGGVVFNSGNSWPWLLLGWVVLYCAACGIVRQITGRFFVENHEMLSGKKSRALLLKNGTALLLPALPDGSNYSAQLDIWDDEVLATQLFVPQSLEREVVFCNGENADLTFCLSVGSSPAQIREYTTAQIPLIAKDQEYLAGVVETLLSSRKELFLTPWSGFLTEKVNAALAKEVAKHPRLGGRGLQAYLGKRICTV